MDSDKLFASIRVLVSRYNAKHSAHYSCSGQPDGSIKVWAVSPPDPKPKPAHPTQLEFLSYLRTLKIGESFTLKSEYRLLFSDIIQWCSDASTNGLAYNAIVSKHDENDPAELTITAEAHTATPAPVWKG